MIDLIKRDSKGRPLGPVRWDCAAEDLGWVLEGRPLWWDDASYIRYQSDDGPQGYRVVELNFREDGRGALVSHFVYYQDTYDEDYNSINVSSTRQERLADEAAYSAAEEASRIAKEAAYDDVPF